MTRIASALIVAATAGAIGLGSAAFASANPSSAETYEYRIRHAQHGEIGTYTNTVTRDGDRTTVTSTMRIAVKLLGMVVYRRDAERQEHWQGDRLVGFTSVEDRNGKRLEVRGEARGDAFLITSPSGTTLAPAHVRPSNPWSADILGADVMMSTSTGDVFPARLLGIEEDIIETEAGRERLRRFEIHSDKREYVWLDANNVPVAFRTEDDGAPIDFVLHRYPSGEAALWPATPPQIASVPGRRPIRFADDR